jgi:hypothetical protein
MNRCMKITSRKKMKLVGILDGAQDPNKDFMLL